MVIYVVEHLQKKLSMKGDKRANALAKGRKWEDLK